MKKRKLLRIMSLLIALAVIATFALPEITNTAEASQYYYFTEPDTSKTFKTGSEIPVSFYCGAVISTTYTNGTVVYQDMPVSFKVYKGDKLLHTEEFTYTRGTTITTSYTPQTSGTLEFRLYGLPYGLGYTEQVLQDTITVKVNKVKASAVKKIKPRVTVERTGKKRAVITCTNSDGFGMKVYRATKKNGKYKLVKKTKKSTFTDKKLKASKVYYYKVKLYAKSGSKTYTSKWSKIRKAKKYVKPYEPVKRPVIVSVKTVGSGSGKTRFVRISWKRYSTYTEKTVGFFVCRKENENDAYVPIEGEVVWKNDVIYLTDNSAESGKTYWYNVYAGSRTEDYLCDTLEPAKYTVP